jgi:hypothetical protein
MCLSKGKAKDSTICEQTFEPCISSFFGDDTKNTSKYPSNMWVEIKCKIKLTNFLNEKQDGVFMRFVGRLPGHLCMA